MENKWNQSAKSIKLPCNLLIMSKTMNRIQMNKKLLSMSIFRSGKLVV